MAISEHAGRPADPSMLVDVDRLVRAYFEIRPDPADPAQRVAFGTSGHRGSSLNGAFNEAHIAATTEAICRYRESQGTDGPLFIGVDPHALSESAFRTALAALDPSLLAVRLGNGDTVEEVVRYDGPEHYAEHTAHLRAWFAPDEPEADG